MNYDVNYFIRKFEAIPEEHLICGNWSSNVNNQHCAGGHCGMGRGRNSEWDEFYALENLLQSVILTPIETDGFLTCYTTTKINDGETKEYQQPTPKQRILAALYDVKRLQETKTIDELLNSVLNDKKDCDATEDAMKNRTLVS